MSKYNLSEAAKEILSNNVSSKRSGQETGVGNSKLKASVAYDTKDVGLIGQSPEKSTVEDLPDYTKGVPTATPPGATPPVSSEKDGVGATKPKNQPGETAGRADLNVPVKADATSYDAIRDRIAGKLAPQFMSKNSGATWQTWEETDLSEHINALMEGENLSDDFKNKATTIFEAAVLSRAEAVVEEIESNLTEQFEAALEEIKEELAEKIDGYLNYMVEEWVKENELAIEKGLRSEIVEDFMEGLRNLFVEHYIDIPQEKVDVVEELTAKVEELEEILSEQINKGVELTKKINEQRKIEAIHAACEGLTQTQVEKLKSLTESVEFTTEEEFTTKLSTLKESYFKSDVKIPETSALDDEVHIEEEKKPKKISDPLMEQYARTISQTLIK